MWGRIWNSLRRGKHIELYLVLVVSIIAAVLALFDIGTAQLIATLTVTAIGLSGFALLEQRLAVEESLNAVRTAVTGARFQAEPPYVLKDVLANSKLVMLAGVDLARTFSNFENDLTAYAQAGNELRVMLYQDTGPAVEYAVARSKRPFSKDRQIQLIQSGRDDFAQLQHTFPGKVSVRLSSSPFPHGVVAANYDKESGFICLKHYTFQCDNYDRPWFRLTAEDGRWYAQFRQEIDAFWAAATPVP